MTSRQQALRAVTVGDVIFGIGAGGQEKLLLVYEADQEGFSARHVTTQMTFRFDRDGRSHPYADGGQCTIASTAALPPEAHEATVGLDRKIRTGKEHPDFMLSQAEIQLLLTHGEFFKARLLPP
jgi:hypothetical protein